MISGVGVAPDIAHPHVEATIGQDVGEALVDQIGKPVSAGAQQAVLQEKHRPGPWREGGREEGGAVKVSGIAE